MSVTKKPSGIASLSAETLVGDKTLSWIASLSAKTLVDGKTWSRIASLSTETHVGVKNAELDSESVNRNACR